MLLSARDCLFGLAVAASVGAMSAAWAVSPYPLETLTGTYAGQNTECPRFRLSTGYEFSVSGPVPELAIGETATMTGHWARASTCMLGRTFQIIPRSDED